MVTSMCITQSRTSIKNQTKALCPHSVDNVWEEIQHIITLHSEQPIQQEVQAMLSLESTITKDHINKSSGIEC